MNLSRFMVCVVWTMLFLHPSARSADDEGCPCAATDPVELVVPELARRSKEPEEPPKLENSPEQRHKAASETPERPRAKVLIVGDSLGLCGFGKTLDTKLRKSPSVSAVYTYLACGTVPISWLKTGPLARAHTACGYWSIEGKSGEPPAEFRDTYGMQHAKRPDSHVVPKIETLLEEHKPDILVIQNGTNLLSLFSDGKTILPSRHDSQIRAYLNPLLRFLADKAPTVKKIYWVGPPVSGRVTPEVQDFLLQRIASYDCPFLNVIDSRSLIKFPYRNTMADKEHFIGRDMDIWAEAVFQRISTDLSGDLLTAAPLSRQKLFPALAKAPNAPSTPPPASASKRPRVVVKAKLVSKSDPLTTEKILPYQESMVSFLYHVDEVLAGDYSESEIVVMHPAHIRLKPEPLANYKIGASFKFELMDFEGSPWESIKRSEETGRIELRPFIRKEDEARFPSVSK
jgi:hypothetical protein